MANIYNEISEYSTSERFELFDYFCSWFKILKVQFSYVFVGNYVANGQFRVNDPVDSDPFGQRYFGQDSKGKKLLFFLIHFKLFIDR